MKFNIQNTFSTELPADPNKVNARRQIENACFSYVTPKKTSAPKLIHTADTMADALGISRTDIESEGFLNLITGNNVLPETEPYAMCYGGHQFGSWAGQLGDGRAINLFETVHKNKRWALQLKGAGETPYSRNADGLAVLRSSVREYLCSEAMFHLGVPTTRALSLALTGDKVLRDMLYDGNSADEKGAIVCRVSPSFIRFGTFEILAARQETELLKQLTDYTIRHFYPEIKTTGKEGYLDFFNAVCDSTLDMIIHWQRVGFVHGVMNTDNMSILGLTIDYGPYGWLEGYDDGWTPNTTDREHKRYRFGNQHHIALWNLFQLANALYPLIEDAKPLEKALDTFKDNYAVAYHIMMLKKLGLTIRNTIKEDETLIAELERILQVSETDMTIFFRCLANLSNTEAALNTIEVAFYKPQEITGDIKENWETWLQNYQKRLSAETISAKEIKAGMDAVNPKYVLRNYMSQLAIDAADKGDYTIIEELYTLLKNPYDEQADAEKWFAKRPEWARHKVGCSMLSCSS